MGLQKVAFIGCESSGTIRRAFQKIGWKAYSCDLLPADDGETLYHIQGDVRKVFTKSRFLAGAEFAIFHPSCQFLTNSGVRWLYNPDGSLNEERWENMREAAEFFNWCLTAVEIVGKGTVENPIMHKHAKALIKPEYSQIIQPWQFGHSTSKATCLWTTGLPNLIPTKIIPKEERTFEIHKATPGPDRWKIRSKTFDGIADAIAKQWGK